MANVPAPNAVAEVTRQSAKRPRACRPEMTAMDVLVPVLVAMDMPVTVAVTADLLDLVAGELDREAELRPARQRPA